MGALSVALGAFAAHKLRETFAGRLDLATREITNVGTFLDAHEPK